MIQDAQPKPLLYVDRPEYATSPCADLSTVQVGQLLPYADVNYKMNALILRTRAEAKAAGLKRYCSGAKCHKGHLAERYTSTAQCVECKRVQYEYLGGNSRKAEHAKRFRDSEKGRHYRLLENARRRAKKHNLEISITMDDYEIPKRCPLLKIQIQLGGDSHFNMNSPSLDRIDNSRGYVKGNVAVISLKANKIKSNLSIEELRSLAQSLIPYVAAGIVQV